MAALYGHDTWADYVVENKMIGSGQKAIDVSVSFYTLFYVFTRLMARMQFLTDV